MSEITRVVATFTRGTICRQDGVSLALLSDVSVTLDRQQFSVRCTIRGTVTAGASALWPLMHLVPCPIIDVRLREGATAYPIIGKPIAEGRARSAIMTRLDERAEGASVELEVYRAPATVALEFDGVEIT